MNEEAQRIDLNDYVQTGEGGTSLTYAHKTRPTMSKLFNLANEDDMAEREFLLSPPIHSKPTGASSLPPIWERMTRPSLVITPGGSWLTMPSDCPIC